MQISSACYHYSLTYDEILLQELHFTQEPQLANLIYWA